MSVSKEGGTPHLFTDVERETLRVLLSVPRGVVEVQLLDVAVLKVFWEGGGTSSAGSR